MNLKKLLSIGILATLTFSPFEQIIPFFKITSTPTYDQEKQATTPVFIETIAPVAANFSATAKKKTYKATGIITFKRAQESFALELPKTVNPQDFSIAVVYKDKKIPIDFDIDGGDERALLEPTYISSPLFFDAQKTLQYEIVSNKKPANFSLWAFGIYSTGERQEVVFNPNNGVGAADDDIVSRSNWQADETLRYEDGTVWAKILAAQKNQIPTAAQKKAAQRIADIRTYLNKFFTEDNKAIQAVYNENGHALVWPIKKTQFVKKIVIHHTAEENVSQKDDLSIMRNMYYYHSVTRGWGDLGYNYVIGHDGTVYEGRAGGRYTIAAHALWNNESTVGISIMGNYENSTLNEKQQTALSSLVQKLSTTYGIDLNQQQNGHRECSTANACLLKDFQTPTLVGHKDVGYTACPGKNVYALLPALREVGSSYSRGYTLVANANTTPPADNTNDTAPTTDDSTYMPSQNFAKGPTVRVRLSYPIDQSVIKIKSDSASEQMKLTVGNRFGYLPKNFEFEASMYGKDQIALKYGKKKYLFKSTKLSASVLQVSNWERIPAWDTSKTHNDNVFKGTLEISSENGKIMLINELPLEDYLKGLAEISNNDNPEKIKTILVAARSYMYFYSLSENRKFPGKNYDGSDNPDEFQKYLGYGYEKRSPKVAKLVDETNGKMVAYNNKVIKPWYFNQSTGQTVSFEAYCQARVAAGSLPKTADCSPIPYLQSKSDPGSVGKIQLGHGVGISGIGATYLATTLNFTFEQIITYYLDGTSIQKIY